MVLDACSASDPTCVLSEGELMTVEDDGEVETACAADCGTKNGLWLDDGAAEEEGLVPDRLVEDKDAARLEVDLALAARIRCGSMLDDEKANAPEGAAVLEFTPGTWPSLPESLVSLPTEGPL